MLFFFSSEKTWHRDASTHWDRYMWCHTSGLIIIIIILVVVPSHCIPPSHTAQQTSFVIIMIIIYCNCTRVIRTQIFSHSDIYTEKKSLDKLNSVSVLLYWKRFIFCEFSSGTHRFYRCPIFERICMIVNMIARGCRGILKHCPALPLKRDKGTLDFCWICKGPVIHVDSSFYIVKSLSGCIWVFDTKGRFV